MSSLRQTWDNPCCVCLLPTRSWGDVSVYLACMSFVWRLRQDGGCAGSYRVGMGHAETWGRGVFLPLHLKLQLDVISGLQNTGHWGDVTERSYQPLVSNCLSFVLFWKESVTWTSPDYSSMWIWVLFKSLSRVRQQSWNTYFQIS